MDYPVGGGGTHGGGGTIIIDAATDGSATGPIVATACVLTDARDLTTVRDDGRGGADGDTRQRDRDDRR